jgi:protein involved in polysaccharide export with SLBB domain
MAQDKPHAGAPQGYRIHIGDVLQISVYRHPELSRRVVVSGDGNYTLTDDGVKVSGLSAIDGLLHDLKVVDLTVMEVAKLVCEKLKSRANNPQVTVIVVSMMITPLPPSTLPSPQLRDTPSPERLLDCCVVREGD